ncbi:MAG: N-acyl-D-amino-acid deacylase family protein [Acidimicrobiales bacterium]
MDDLIIKNGTIVDGTGATDAFVGDVAVNDGVITEVGTADNPIDRKAKRVIDAEGQLVTPGFVDIHTHFDGQFCWDKQVTPSSWHGITTVVAGNCGVGFAPVHPGTENSLIEIMESVEDIPGVALNEGIPWNWETFGEYLNVIDTPYSVDIGTQVGHVAVRHYVMGERCYDDATADDIAKMADITRQALADGAMGFTTSRFFGHRDKAGELIPGTNASADELIAIGDALKDAGHGTIELVSDHLQTEEELAWIEHIVTQTGRPLTALVNANPADDLWAMADRLKPQGLQIRPQVGARPASLLLTLDGTLNPMKQFVTYREIRDLPIDEQRRKLRDPEFRAKVLADEQREARFPEATAFSSTWHKMYPLPEDLSYEPAYADSLAGIAEARGCHVREALMDTMAAGRPILVFVGAYPGDLDSQAAALLRDNSVFGLSDGGAHCGVLCDASVPTYMLAYMSRDRTKGPTLPLEFTVNKMTKDTAEVYGLTDRGVIAPGYRADLNLIDFDALALHDPEMVWDLPAGGRRLVQRADGYVATICAGEVTYEHGQATGAMPGRLIRGGTTSG